MSCSWVTNLRVIWYPLPSCDSKWTRKHRWPKGRSPSRKELSLGPSSVTPLEYLSCQEPPYPKVVPRGSAAILAPEPPMELLPSWVLGPFNLLINRN